MTRNLKELYYMSPTEGSRAQRVVSVGEPGPGGAYHEYRIDVGEWNDNDCEGPNRSGNPSFIVSASFPLRFQVGPYGENAPNGITTEALVLVLIDHLKGFVAAGAPFPTRETSLAITKFEEGLMWLQARQHDRLRRGVQGKSEK